MAWRGSFFCGLFIWLFLLCFLFLFLCGAGANSGFGLFGRERDSSVLDTSELSGIVAKLETGSLSHIDGTG